jgi:hypothetical protein
MNYSGLSRQQDSQRPYIGMIVTEKNTTQTVAAAATIEGYQVYINPATTAAIKGLYIPCKAGYEDKTKPAEYTDANTGKTYQTNRFPFAGYMYGELSEQDYDTFKDIYKGGCDVKFIRDDFKIVTCKDSAGLEKGFSARIFTETPAPAIDGAGMLKDHPFYVICDYWEEWNAKILIQPSFLLPELEALTPIGLDIEVMTAYEASGKTVVVKATYRGTKTNAKPAGTPATNLGTTGEWELVSHQDTGGAISTVGATLANNGIYTLTVVNTAAAMTNDFVIRGVKITASHVTYLTNYLTVPV